MEPGRSPEDALQTRVLRLNAMVTGVALGVLVGLGLFVATNWLILKGGEKVGPHLGLLGQFFVGYKVTFLGSVIGLGYGFVCGFVVGFLIAAMHNRSRSETAPAERRTSVMRTIETRAPSNGGPRLRPVVRAQRCAQRPVRALLPLHRVARVLNTDFRLDPRDVRGSSPWRRASRCAAGRDARRVLAGAHLRNPARRPRAPYCDFVAVGR